MITFIYGDDTKKSREKLDKVKAEFLKKYPNGSLIVAEGESATDETLAPFSEETELFAPVRMVIFSGWCENAETQEQLLEALKELSTSARNFIVFERTVDARVAKKISAQANETHHFPKGQFSGKPEFNIFSVANALGERDKKKLWLLLMRAMKAGIAPEEIHGTLFWQVKAMMLAKDAADGIETNTGLNPFVLQNATRYAKNFSDKELAALSRNLVDTYHRAHQGEIEFSHALERLALAL